MVAKKKSKKTIDQLAVLNAKQKKKLARVSAMPAPASCIRGRSFAKPEIVEAPVEDVQEESCTSSPE